jgi:multidrug efflux pump subunit AcrA (membrane-fusion protein)
VPPPGSYTPLQKQVLLSMGPTSTTPQIAAQMAKFDDDNRIARENALTRQRQAAADARQAEQDRIAAADRELKLQDRLADIEEKRQAALRAGRKEEADALAAKAVASKTQFDQANTLRDEATKITETFRPMQEAYERIGEAAKAGNALGDLGLIYTYTRLLDPATVHEEEIKRGMKAGGFGEYVSGWMARVTKGELLTPKVRQDFVEMARKFYDVRKKGYDQELGRYRTLAEKFGLDPDTVAVSLARDQGPPPGLTVVIP